jgi:transposase-like protein
VLSIVDNRLFRRLAFRVLEQDPDQEDLRSFLTDFKTQLDRRALVVVGITTDASSLYPNVLKELWPAAPHQICVFHVVKEITDTEQKNRASFRREGGASWARGRAWCARRAPRSQLIARSFSRGVVARPGCDLKS